ncbi:hypothetical protein BDDG_13841 [Blastomyces dermatitidis ATCC 18188]|uniref:Uncharacterized protein n=2 Tax=Ajellomyces dermatitidis (strain ATCC 18188 / CBS 674.68) TaxID=653446 RepID=A0A0J9EX04_AJEDA|nr:hypothetical protein BDDG_13841 [Blastomyces dermatitidis ATCC 18188]
MPPRTRATAGLLDTPASNMDMDEEYGQDTPTPMPRGGEMGSQTGGQMNENAMIRMMMDYMEKQDKRMEMLIQKLGSNSSSLSTTQDPISEYRKDAKAKLEGKHVIILNGSVNYLEWKSSILADAHLIQAKDVLIKGETVPPTTVPLDIELWNRKNELLYTRIFQSLNATVRDSLGPLDEDAYLAATIWKNLARRYAISRAEERLLTTKKMRDLRLKNSDFHTYLANFRDLKAKLVSLGENWAECTYHDLFILGLGDWQQEFIRMKLDEFYATKQGPIQNLNLDDLMDQLATRATTNMPATITRPSTASPVTERFDERQCHYCDNTGHIIKYCWFKNPNLANAEWKERNKERIEALKAAKDKKNKDKDDILMSQPGHGFFAGVSPDVYELMKDQPSYSQDG